MMKKRERQNIYSQIIEKVFFKHFKTRISEVPFRRSDIEEAARELKVRLPKNLGDIDKKGSHYVFPVQAKGVSDKIGVVQIDQDLAVCVQKFPRLICRPIAAQSMGNKLIALFELESTERQIRIVSQKHYRLANPDELRPEELETYRDRRA